MSNWRHHPLEREPRCLRLNQAIRRRVAPVWRVQRSHLAGVVGEQGDLDAVVELELLEHA
jgi:hypothetical protein